MTLNIYTDGGSRGNPGPAAVGFVIKNASGTIIHSFGKTIGIATNNLAEYQAVIVALEWLSEKSEFVNHQSEIVFHLDSQLVVNQLNGLWKIKDTQLRQKIIFLRELEAKVGGSIKYAHIPREKNTAADRLVNLALDHLI
ncbi:MAG: ribonuclease HI family protein [Candidatus Beckwithbacteria bacterium]|nr:ribonuclease HI family protein [Candidatus Beckwithbacteria bacterium]